MNCKPGDLAVIVRSLAGNEGKIVRCVRYLGDDVEFWSGYVGPSWEIDPPLRSFQGGLTNVGKDEHMRPIRPGDISDEEVRDLYAPKVLEAA